MKKIIISLIATFVLLNTTNWFEGDRVCETQYSTIVWVKYFSGLHCTENIKLSGVIADKKALKDISSRKINDFIAANNHRIISHLEWSWSCDTINTIEEITEFENIIYSNNDISYTETTTEIEDLITEIEELREEYNELGLYNTVFDEIQIKYPLSSLDSQRNLARDAYYTKQLDIKTEILDKQKEKLTLLYKITESQKFIEWFYTQVNRVCKSYEGEYSNKEIEEESEEEAKREALIEKYKEEFNTRLGAKLDSLPRQVLENLSVKLISYVETSAIFKRLSEKQKELVKLKITAFKAAVDDRLE